MTILSSIWSVVRWLLVLLRILSPLPSTAIVSFFLYQNAANDRVPLTNETYNLMHDSKETLVLFHGWTQNSSIGYYNSIAEQYALKDDYNIILVDWKEEADNLDYVTILPALPRIGDFIGNYLVNLHKLKHIDIVRTHLIGHSLGGQLVGNVGKATKKRGLTLSKITALDPAGIAFEPAIVTGLIYSLAKTDAKNVHVLHTSLVGTISPMGTLDLYFNAIDGNLYQPGCFSLNPNDATFCSHYFSWRIFIPFINNKENCFVGRNCVLGCNPDNGELIFNGDMPDNSTGLWYVQTNTEEPYYTC